MTPITSIQRNVLQFLRSFQQRCGYMPTAAEISADMGWKSANAAHEQLMALERRGYITRQPGIGRSIRLTPAAQQLLDAAAALPQAQAPDMLALPVVDMARVNREGSA